MTKRRFAQDLPEVKKSDYARHPCRVLRFFSSMFMPFRTDFLSRLQSGAISESFGASPVRRCIVMSAGIISSASATVFI